MAAYDNGCFHISGCVKNPLFKHGFLSIGPHIINYHEASDILRCTRVEALNECNVQRVKITCVNKDINGGLSVLDPQQDNDYIQLILFQSVEYIEFKTCILCCNHHQKVPVIKKSKEYPMHGKCFEQVLKYLLKDNEATITFVRFQLCHWVYYYIDPSCDLDYVYEQLLYYWIAQVWNIFVCECQLCFDHLPDLRIKSHINEDTAVKVLQNQIKEAGTTFCLLQCICS